MSPLPQLIYKTFTDRKDFYTHNTKSFISYANAPSNSNDAYPPNISFLLYEFFFYIISSSISHRRIVHIFLNSVRSLIIPSICIRSKNNPCIKLLFAILDPTGNVRYNLSLLRRWDSPNNCIPTRYRDYRNDQSHLLLSFRLIGRVN